MSDSDIGCYGGLAPTPRIDALAAEGVRFKNYVSRTGSGSSFVIRDAALDASF
jgi:arylsulfatase A-like enzyme